MTVRGAENFPLQSASELEPFPIRRDQHQRWQGTPMVELKSRGGATDFYDIPLPRSSGRVGKLDNRVFYKSDLFNATY